MAVDGALQRWKTPFDSIRSRIECKFCRIVARALVASRAFSNGKAKPIASARQAAPSYLGLIHTKEDKCRPGQIRKVRFSHIAAAGLANLQSDRQKLRCCLTGPCRMVSVRSVSALSLLLGVDRQSAAVRTGTIVVLPSWPDMASMRNKEPGSLDYDRGWTIVLLVVACAVVALYLPFFWEP